MASFRIKKTLYTALRGLAVFLHLRRTLSELIPGNLGWRQSGMVSPCASPSIFFCEQRTTVPFKIPIAAAKATKYYPWVTLYLPSALPPTNKCLRSQIKQIHGMRMAVTFSMPTVGITNRTPHTSNPSTNQSYLFFTLLCSDIHSNLELNLGICLFFSFLISVNSLYTLQSAANFLRFLFCFESLTMQPWNYLCRSG